MFEWLFYTGNWPRRWNCGQWSEAMGWTTIIAEFLVWAAYMAIPLVLIYFIRKRTDIPFHRIFLLFAAFIVSCGFTHLIEAIIFWFPMYRFLTLMLIVTALVSWATVFALIPIVPRILALPSLANVNELLKKDISNVNDRLEIALETLKSGVWDLNLKTRDLFLSRICIDMLKMPGGKKEFTLSDFFDKIFFEDRGNVEKNIQESFAENETRSLEFRLLASGNNVEKVRISWRVICDENKMPSRIVGSMVSLQN